MHVGSHEVYWHRPLVAYRPLKTGSTTVLSDVPLGYLTAYDAGSPTSTSRSSFGPASCGAVGRAAMERFRIHRRSPASAAQRPEAVRCRFTFGIEALPAPCPAVAPGGQGRDAAEWLRRSRSVEQRMRDGGRTGRAGKSSRGRFDDSGGRSPDSLTYHRTARGRSRWPTGRRSPVWPRAVRQQGQRRLRGRSGHAAGSSTTIAIWKPWAIICWPITSGGIRQQAWPARPSSAICRSAGAPISTFRGRAAGCRTRRGRPASANLVVRHPGRRTAAGP